jgi:LysM domain
VKPKLTITLASYQAKKSHLCISNAGNMKKLFSVLFIVAFFASVSSGQGGQLIIKNGSKGLYLDHAVAAKEGLFSIGRIYNVHPRFIASYNNIDYNKGLSIGQTIHIPLTDTNFSQNKKSNLPVYYRSEKKETLQKVSAANNKVLIKNLRDWNKFYKDTVASGSKLIVGYMIADEKALVAILKRPEPKDSSLKNTLDKLPVVDAKTDGSLSVVKNDPKKDDAKKGKDDKAIIKTDKAADKPIVKTETTPDKHVQKEEPKKEEPKRAGADTVVMHQEITPNMSGQGYFKSSFDQQVRTIPVSKTETVTSGIFKMVNGPQEAKYYVLADAVPSGTIVRIINPENNRTVYAKVLGDMNSTKSNQGVNIRISNTAASALGISDTDKFIVTVNY